MRGERTDGPQFGQASAGLLDGGRLFGPHERGSRRSPERALLASLAAFGLERQKLRDVAVGEGRYEGVLVRVEKSHARYRRFVDGGRLDQVFDRYSAGRDPAVSRINVQAIAIADRAVMDHEAAFAPARAGTQMVEVAAFVIDDGRHTSPPQSWWESFVTIG